MTITAIDPDSIGALKSSQVRVHDAQPPTTACIALTARPCRFFRAQERSSVGRASVSKTEGRGFESCRSCHVLGTKRPLGSPRGAFPLPILSTIVHYATVLHTLARLTSLSVGDIATGSTIVGGSPGAVVLCVSRTWKSFVPFEPYLHSATVQARFKGSKGGSRVRNISERPR